MSALFFLLNALSLSVDSDAIRRNLRQTFETERELLVGSSFSFSNCLIAGMTIHREGNRLDLIVSPLRIYGKNRPQRICDGLEALVYEGSVNPQTHVTLPYHQLLNGYRVVFSFLLAYLTVGEIIITFKFIAVLVVALTLSAFIWKSRAINSLARQPVTGASSMAWTALAVQIAIFLLFYDPWTQANSFFRFTTDLLILGFLAASTIFSFVSLKREIRVATFAVFGALIAYFEIPHGGIALASAAIVCVIFVQSTSSGIPKEALRMAAESLVAFGASVATCFAVKILIVTILIDAQYPWRFVDLLMFRISGDPRTEVSPEIVHHYVETDASIRILFQTFYGWASSFGFGNRSAGLLVFAAAALGHILGAFTLLWAKDRSTRAMLLGMLISSALIGVWFLTFREHTIRHAFMSPLMAWPVGVGGAMILLFYRNLVKALEPVEVQTDQPTVRPSSRRPGP